MLIWLSLLLLSPLLINSVYGFKNNPFADLALDIDYDCICECNVSSIVYPFDNRGYGKYTGVRYSCPYLEEKGCDPLDECSHAHDICIEKYGYLNSCFCNIELINCATPLQGKGFVPCEKMQEAKYIVLKYICDAILYEPAILGGCNSSTNIPKICLEQGGASSLASHTRSEAIEQEQVVY